MSEADLLAGRQELVRYVRGRVAKVVGGVLVVAERSMHLAWRSLVLFLRDFFMMDL